jgi:hypothetical protein
LKKLNSLSHDSLLSFNFPLAKEIAHIIKSNGAQVNGSSKTVAQNKLYFAASSIGEIPILGAMRGSSCFVRPLFQGNRMPSE